MKKPLDFPTYKILRKMSYNDFNRWLVNFYGTAFEDGLNSAQEAFKPFDIVCELEPEDCKSALSTDDLKDVILSVKGIGDKRADEIVQAILDRGVDYSLWE